MTWPPDPKEVARHDRKAHKARSGQRYNTPPPKKRGGCSFTLAAVAVSAYAVRKDYGPQGACSQKAALLVLIPALLGRLVWKARRR